MSCAIDHAYVWACIVLVVQTLRETIGNDGIVFGLLTGTSVVLVRSFQWVQGLVVPRVLRFVVEDLYRKAKELFQGSWLFKDGIRFKTCLVSVIFGVALYPMLKFAARFPAYLLWSLAFIGVAALIFTLLGYFLSPKLKSNRAFFKVFYIPAIASLCLFIFNFVLDLVISVTAVAIALSL